MHEPQRISVARRRIATAQVVFVLAFCSNGSAWFLAVNFSVPLSRKKKRWREEIRLDQSPVQFSAPIGKSVVDFLVFCLKTHTQNTNEHKHSNKIRRLEDKLLQADGLDQGCPFLLDAGRVALYGLLLVIRSILHPSLGFEGARGCQPPLSPTSIEQKIHCFVQHFGFLSNFFCTFRKKICRLEQLPGSLTFSLSSHYVFRDNLVVCESMSAWLHRTPHLRSGKTRTRKKKRKLYQRTRSEPTISAS